MVVHPLKNNTPKIEGFSGQPKHTVSDTAASLWNKIPESNHHFRGKANRRASGTQSSAVNAPPLCAGSSKRRVFHPSPIRTIPSASELHRILPAEWQARGL